MSAVGYVLLTPMLLAAGALWRGYALTVLWDWFVVPTFAVTPLAIAPAIGVSLVVGYLTYHAPAQTGNRPFAEALSEYAFQATALPAVALAIGWIVTYWMPQ